ncbi:ABC transporter substrate-binding protein [Pseudoalteromonas byunsanensis]|uniref:Solute-binding protein family 3/N-terminal domain-containing protein n=1 Tax=Pseudoalteromonas byunsanensis TaxID=327939 RepID=A0A1S1N1D4_9GAMM|nr:ABC transporter substrate-binding protein [Pseudoalteromonas byunsanensis]OHU93478.1 hypothetical protein BIW53_19170 [Pseudoalteromonas byunsanensis]
MIQVLVCILVIISCNSFAKTIRYVDATILRNNPNNMYFVKVLELALAKASKGGEAQWLQPLDVIITQQRQLIELKKKNIDVMWTMSSAQRDRQALAVPVPLAFGSYGLRVLVINKGDQHVFSRLKRAEQLKKLTALVGRDWPDKSILLDNGYQIDDSYNEELLYSVLQNENGYYFPRAVTEANSELSVMNNNQLMITPRFVMQYPAVMYFYVRKGNQELAQKLTQGLKKALEDGSLEQLFFSFEHHRKAFSAFDFTKAEFIQLENRQLHASADLTQIYEMQKRLIDNAFN